MVFCQGSSFSEFWISSMKFKDNFYPTIEMFHQKRTYYGLLAGIPDSETNARQIKYDEANARRIFGDIPIHLVSPIEKKWTNRNGEEKAELPKITCMVELSHYQPMNDKSKECSKLCLIWYQNGYAFPIDKKVIEHIARLEWSEYSEDAYL